MTAAALVCGSCGTELPPNSKFCNECGAAVATATTPAEYKQVTVLFADVVRSMDIASAVGAERLREIMAELADCCAAVVKRFGGTVDKFTGDGIMAVFGAPVAMEDHAIRACLAALGLQEQTKRVAVDVQARDGVDLRLRVGLNSGQVIAGEIGSGPFGYTAIGEQVGMAQRMESVAPPGGMMLSASTARLVEGAATLSESELVEIKGADAPVPARRLLGMAEGHRAGGRAESNLVGRRWEMSAVDGLLDRAIGGHGAVVGVVGSPGIGKSRVVREVGAMAGGRGVDVFATYCESHTADIPFHAVTGLLRAAMRVNELDADAARTQLHARLSDADSEDLVLLDDLLGIADPDVVLPPIDPDARRRRLTALVNAASLARETPALYIIEDAHWIDEVSESMLTEFLVVIPQTASLVLVTYRPEYHGALTQMAGAQTVALAPLSDTETAALVSGLLGPDPSVGALGQTIADRAAGNPFFAEEIVRELAERGVLRGSRSAYESTADAGEVSVPATLQATIAARIDRLDRAAKRTLSAAAVIGSRFSRGLLETLDIDPVLGDLVSGEFIDQIRFTRQPEYVFHHPLVRAVAYESQLKSDRAELHRRVAAAIESRDPAATEENAALIAEHLEAASDLYAAYAWHMRAGTWSTNRDIAAAHVSWGRARGIADALASDQHDRPAMRIAPRTLIAATAWRVGGSGADTGFDELRELCTALGDQRSLALGMSGQIVTLFTKARLREASRLASELIALLEQIGDPALTVATSVGPFAAKHETAEMSDLLRFTQHVIEQTHGNLAKDDLIIGAPVAGAYLFRANARWCLGIRGWKDDLTSAASVARADPTSRAGVAYYTYVHAVPNGVVLPDVTALCDTAETLDFAERFGDNISLNLARIARAVVLVRQDGPERAVAFDLFATLRHEIVNERFNWVVLPVIDLHLADEKARLGELDEAIDLARSVLDGLYDAGGSIVCVHATTVLAQALLRRGIELDLREAQTVIDRLAAFPGDPAMALIDVPVLRLRALLAQAHGDEAGYRECRDRYRQMATDLGFEGHMAIAEAMP